MFVFNALENDPMKPADFIDLALMYADVYPGPVDIDMSKEDARILRNHYSRELFGSKPPWLSDDEPKKKKFERVCKILEGCNPRPYSPE